MPGALNLIGTPGPDVLVGAEGNDTITGLDGNDRLLGNAGNDILNGGDGVDTLNGGDGNDNIQGGATAADLRDVIFAGAGNDSVDAGAGNDQVFGQEGNDTIAGGAGVDDLQGQDGDDVITGSAFSDLVFGGAGNDFVNGGFGSDRINGGSGADKFFHAGVLGHGSDWIQDYVAADGDVLLWGGAAATASDFQVNFAHTANDAGERSWRRRCSRSLCHLPADRADYVGRLSMVKVRLRSTFRSVATRSICWPEQFGRAVAPGCTRRCSSAEFQNKTKAAFRRCFSLCFEPGEGCEVPKLP